MKLGSDRLKAILANKWTLYGYCARGTAVFSAGAGIVFGASNGDWIPAIAGIAGAIAFAGSAQVALETTRYGEDTLKQYENTREDLQDPEYRKAFDRRTENGAFGRYYSTLAYCNRVGVDLALKEAGIDAGFLKKYKPLIPI